MSHPPPPEGESSESGGPDHGQQGYGQGQPPYGQQQPYGYDPGQPYGYGQGQQPYGQNQPYGYGPASPYQQGYYPGGPRPEHPGAVPSLVIGVIALAGGFVCGLPFLLGPWAWVKGKRTMDEIDASGGQVGGRGMAHGGYICGIIATVLLILGVLLLVVGVTLGILAGTVQTG